MSCEQVEPDSSTETGYNHTQLPHTPQCAQRSVARTDNKHLKARHRRVKANARERSRMHGLNDALETLRGHIPLSYHHQRLSKIETLRLARNYIAILSRSLQQDGPPDNMDCARTLAQGLSQTTSNLIASTFQVHPRVLMNDGQSPHTPSLDASTSYSPAPPMYGHSPAPCMVPQQPMPIPLPPTEPQYAPMAPQTVMGQEPTIDYFEYPSNYEFYYAPNQ